MLFAFSIAAGALFVADTAAHLFAVAHKKERLRRVTKVLLMPLLALTFSLLWLSFFSGAFPWVVVAGLLMGCAGDTLLLNHHHKAGLPLGLAAFSAGHVLYIVQIWRTAVPPAWWAVAVLALAYCAVVSWVYKKLWPYLQKAFRFAALGYMLLISALSFSAAAAAAASFSLGAALLLSGTLLFMLSDGILSFEVFRRETRGGHLKVMAPYIAAQALIAAGFLLSPA